MVPNRPGFNFELFQPPKFYIFAKYYSPMKTIRILLIAFSALLLSCKESNQDQLSISEISSKRIQIDESIKGDEDINKFIAPFKEHLNNTLDSTLAYNPKLLSKNDGDLNTAIGNMMADALMLQANPVIKKRTGRDIDFVLLNHGGIRSELPQGGVSTRSAYNLMPFENEIVVAELSGVKIKEMLRYLERAKTAHPVSKEIQIRANKDYSIFEAKIKGEQIDKNKTYLVATSDYLYNGGDNMAFFKDPINLYSTNYKIRNALIDYFTRVDTIKADIDKRYIRE